MDTLNGLDREALFADETLQFRYPYEAEAGDEVTFRFRTRRDNVSSVTLIGRATRRQMEKTFSRGMFDYYETTFVIGNDPFRYCFEIQRDEERCIFNKLGVSNSIRLQEENCFIVCPGFATPDWAKGAVIYQIFVDRFMNGDPSNDTLTNEYYYLKGPVQRIRNWEEPLSDFDVRRFYGGDLIGVREKLDYLKRLGIDAIYFNPIFVSPSNHKYDIQDYDHIDPHLTGFKSDKGSLLEDGSGENSTSTRYVDRVTNPLNLEYANQYFAELVQEIHKRGMKVIIDGVFNHCGSFNKWMDREKIYSAEKGYGKGAYIAKDSPYHNYFIFEDGEWPDNGEYIGWWGHETLPKLNYEHSKELHDYVLQIARKWLAHPYNVDGWRLDVAADLGSSDRYNHTFWRDFRMAVKEENPDALILAEHYGNPEAWLKGDQWDSIMNYDAFMEPVSFFLTGMEKHSDEYDPFQHGNGKYFFQNLLQKMSRLPRQSLHVAMNELSNHDHSRFMTRTNGMTGRLGTRSFEEAGKGVSYGLFRAGVVMQFTLPGAPTIYYGDETGLAGWTDPDSRRTFPWGHEDWNMVTFHRDMIRIYKKHNCLKNGSFIPLVGEQGYIAYGRFDAKGAAAIAVNQSNEEQEIRIPVWQLGIDGDRPMIRIMETNEIGYNIGAKKVKIKSGYLNVSLPPRTAAVYATD